MGVNCQIIKNKSGEVERVTSPNGMDSLLYYSAERIVGDKNKAMDVWATAYTPKFMEYYGDWMNPLATQSFDTDINGEPLLDDVLAFMKKDTYVIGSMTATDVLNLNNFVNQLGFESVQAASKSIKRNFVVGGILNINETNLSESGLYNNLEIKRILSSDKIRLGVIDSMRKLIDAEASDNVNNPRYNYYTKPNYSRGLIVYKSGSFDSYGKQIPYNESEIDNVVRNAVSGFVSFSDFSKRIRSVYDYYPELVNKFQSDNIFASSLYNNYTNHKPLYILSIDESGLEQTSPSSVSSKLSTYSHSNASKLNESKSVISSFLGLTEEEWAYDTNKVSNMLHNIEKVATNFGIDIIGLRGRYDSDIVRIQAEYDSFVASLDMYLSGLHREDGADVTELSSAIESFIPDSPYGLLSHGQAVSAGVPAHAAGQALLFVEKPASVSSSDVFSLNKLLEVHPNIYQRINNEYDDISEIYNDLASYVKINPLYIPFGVYTDSYIKNGKIDVDKIKSTASETDIKSMIKDFVIANSDSSNTEEMILNRLIFSHPIKVEQPEVDTQREFNRYMNKKEGDRASAVHRLWSGYLLNKLNNTDLFDKVYKHIDFRSGDDIALMSSDTETLRQIELNSKPSLKKDLMMVAMSSTHPSMSNLFYLDNSNMAIAGEDFMHYMYKRNPMMLNEVNMSNITVDGNNVIGSGIYDDFIRIGTDIYSKVSESSEGSVYNLLEGTEAEVKQKAISSPKPSINTGYYSVSDNQLKNNMTLNTSEKNMLEC